MPWPSDQMSNATLSALMPSLPTALSDAVVRRRLLDQRADRGVDVVERGLLGALERVGVGAGDDLRLLALVHVGVGELVVAVLGDLAVVDVDAQVGAVVAHQAQPVGRRIEVDRRPRARRQHWSRAWTSWSPCRSWCRPCRCRRRRRPHRACRRPGRTSMPSTLPSMPVMFQVFTTFFWLVSTIEMVLSPHSAATSAACAADAVMRSAAEAASMDLMVIANLPVFAVARLRRRAGYGAERPSGCSAAGQEIVSGRCIHIARCRAYPGLDWPASGSFRRMAADRKP